MPNYFYTAKSFDGQTETGVFNAKDEYQLSQNLKNRGFILIKAVVNEKIKKSRFHFPIYFPGISLNEKIIMTRK